MVSSGLTSIAPLVLVTDPIGVMLTEVAFVDVHESCDDASSPLIVVGFAIRVTVGLPGGGGGGCWSLLLDDLLPAPPQAVRKSEKPKTAAREKEDSERDTWTSGPEKSDTVR